MIIRLGSRQITKTSMKNITNKSDSRRYHGTIILEYFQHSAYFNLCFNSYLLLKHICKESCYSLSFDIIHKIYYITENATEQFSSLQQKSLTSNT